MVNYCPKCKKYVVFGRPDFQSFQAEGIDPKNVRTSCMTPENEQDKCPFCKTKLINK